MASLSLNSNSHHGGGSTKAAAKKMNKGLSAPASPRALALNKMKDNDEDDWAKAWAEDSGSDDDDEEEEEEEDEGVGGGGDKIIGGGGDQLPPSMPVLTGQSAAMGQHQQSHQQQQQPQQQYVQQQYIQQQARPAPYTTPGQPQPKELPPTDRIVQQQLFTSPPPQQQQQQYQQAQQYQPQQQHQHQQAIMGDEDAKLLLEADQALLKDGGSWDPYCADESVEEKPCVEMFDPALRVLGRGSFGRVSTVIFLESCLGCLNVHLESTLTSFLRPLH